MRASLDSAPSWIDKKIADSTMIKRPRKTSNQANRERFETKAIEEHVNSRYKEALKLASKELSININGPNKGKRGFGARAVAEKYNAVYLNEEGDKQITRTTLSNYADEELAGISPLKNGRPAKIPSHLKMGLATHAVMQVSGTEGEASSAKLKEVAQALVSGTEWEDALNLDYVVRRTLEDNPTILQLLLGRSLVRIMMESLTG